MENLSYKIIAHRQSTQKKVYAFLCLILAGVIAGYSYFKWQDYLSAQDGLLQNEATLNSLNQSLEKEKTAYFASKDKFDALNKQIDTSASEILPKGDQYTELTRQMDAIEKELSANETFEISNIDYGAESFDEQTGYGILPVRMNIKSSQANFIKLLQMLETSGSFANKLRLMSISSIRLNFGSSSDSTGSKMITFSLQLNAYYQR